jgi:hypothetical protein
MSPVPDYGALVRKETGSREHYGTVASKNAKPGELICVEWHPDFVTHEDPAELVVISVLQMRAA